uniref:Reverse transcriptase domain-containing protein n=2 Tax=Tanacetum cinerariifolium TaxID=118510 RepID=A0A699HXT7_TANCI|nr:hypothetical protein [Tanacetum cinerariifolium]
MSSDSHATFTYTSMSSYEVIVNGYFGMPMDPLDPYSQLVIKAPPSPDYIPRPEAPISPDYIPGPEYPEYLPPADDVLPDEEQPLPAAVSPTVEWPGYITDSEPKMDPEEEDGDDEKSEGDFIDYPTRRGDDDTDDDGDDLSEDDADDDDEEESSDSEEEEEEHLALTVPAPALHTTPPPSAYHDAARISVRPHIPMPFRLESEVERLLFIPTPPLSPVSPTSYPLPPFLMPLPIFTPLPPPPPIILPRTKASMVLIRSARPSTFILAPRLRTPPIGTPPIESIPKADMPLRKRARFTTPTGGYEVGKSFVAAARQIRPALTVDDSRRAKDRLIGRLRRESDIFVPCLPFMRGRLLTLVIIVLRSWTTASHERFIPKMAPKRARTTRANPDPTRTTTVTEHMTQEAINRTQNTENQVKFASCTLIGSALTWWNSHMRAVTQEVAYAMPWKILRQMITANYTLRFQELALLCGRMFLEESDKIERYVGGLPKMIRGNVMSYEPKSIQKAIEFANDQMDQKLLGIADRQADNKRKFDNTSWNQQN